MRKLILWISLFSFAGPCITIAGSTQSADRLLDAAKLDTFDEKWLDALEKLRELQDIYPEERAAILAVFWEALCLEKLGEEENALIQYEKFLRQSDKRMPQFKQAEFSIVRLACQLYRQGNRRYINRALRATESPDDEVRLLAGVQISFLSDSRIRRKAVPILLDFMQTSSDPEIQNQAALALLRIDPGILEELGLSGRSGDENRKKGSKKSSRTFLRFTIQEDGVESIRISLPLSLARMLFSSLPEEARRHLETKGINPENILEELENADEMLEIKSGGQIFRIWVE